MGIKVAIDASRVRSGGGVAHLLGILDIPDPMVFGIAEIHVWAYAKLLDVIPGRSWLIKHGPPALEKTLLQQAWWQGRQLSDEIKAQGCDILFSVDASTFCRFAPMVVLNQNMLAYDKDVLALFGWGKDRFQQTMMYFVQKRAFHAAAASIFLTRHAAREVQRRVGKLANTTCISHGVAEVFKQTKVQAMWPEQGDRPIRCLYVSPVFEYKHQNEVVLAIKRLRDDGVNLQLTLVGGGGARALRKLHRLLAEVDPERSFVSLLPFFPNNEIATYLSEADIFIFASSCETFGIALVEAMAVGVPIASSNRSSLRETLADGGEYFDPLDVNSISSAVLRLIESPGRRADISARAKKLAEKYSWQRCANETWRFIAKTYQDAPKGRAGP